MATRMASAISSGHEPEPPDDDCIYPQMRYEKFRIATFAPIAYLDLPLGVRPSKLACDGYFQIQNRLIACYDCGLHYGLGHKTNCRADLCSIPLALTNVKMKEERDGIEAVSQAAEMGLLGMREHVRLAGPTDPAAIHPSCGIRDRSNVHSVRSGRPERRPNMIEDAGFQIVDGTSVSCRDCHSVIHLEMLTPLRNGNSLEYVLQRHAVESPACTARPQSS